ncbi:MAG: C-terminal binding protein [Azospirillaceae bacterium]
MARGSLLVTDYTFPGLDAEAAAAERCGLDLDARQCRTEAEVIAGLTGARAVLVQFAPFGAAAVAALAQPSVIVRYGVGYDNVDVAAARAAGHRVCYVPDYCSEEVADHTVAALLSLLRRLPALDAHVRAGGWKGVEVARPLPPFDRQVVGFIGLGRIGRAVLDRLRPFGFGFMVADPALTDDAAERLGVTLAARNAVLGSADAVLLHAPSTPETRDMIDASALASMKRGAVLVNCARGDLVVEADLATALIDGRLAAAALDVFRSEPLPADSPLRQAPNLLLTPHLSWYSDRAMGRLQALAAEEVERFFRGEAPRRPVPAT